jgi:hypothetical protein
MRKLSILLLVVAVVAVWSLYSYVGTASAEDAKEEAKRTYVGAAKCKTCHKKEAAGAQFVKWSESAHAGAFATLASPEALEIGKKVGVEKPQESDTCLRCHVTGHGVAAELLGTKYAKEDGVGCESCHGAGGDYYKKKTMAGIVAGEIDRTTVGLTRPTTETCEGCHNDQSPTFKGFKFDEYSKKIAHPWPDAYKASLSGGAR